MNNINKYFIVYGDGSNIKSSRVDVGINNNYVSINIPKEIFAEMIHLNQYSNGDSYSYTYKYYDDYRKLVEE